jgi:nucleotide-binding universal stress UspA family protein
MYKSILVPTDGSKLSGKAVKEAISFAKACGSKITILHVMPDARAYISERYSVPTELTAPLKKKFQGEAAARSQEIIDQACAQSSAAGVKCTGISVVGDEPYEAIISQAKKSKSDLIMMASHGRKGLQSLLLGSETAKVLVHSKVPVLVVR